VFELSFGLEHRIVMRCKPSRAKEDGLPRKDRPVDPETGWKPILHCAVAAATQMS
jgi:hypothetical protein